jgi:hypothetical protein
LLDPVNTGLYDWRRRRFRGATYRIHRLFHGSPPNARIF